MRVMFASVVYPAAELYLEDFLLSLKRQSCQLFDVCLLNDGIDEQKLQDVIHICNMKRTEVVNAESGNSIAENRLQLIDCGIKCNYDLLIFGDCDDVFSERRVELIKQAYSDSAGFYYHDIKILGREEAFFADDLPESIVNVSEIIDGNFLGLSNTALNLNRLSESLQNSKAIDLTAVDWYLFSRLLLNGAEGTKVDGILTDYRIHDQNTAGEMFVLDEHSLLRGIEVKLQHYSALQDSDPIYKKRKDQMEDLKAYLSSGGDPQTYIDKVNGLSGMKKYWWQNIVPLEALSSEENSKNR